VFWPFSKREPWQDEEGLFRCAERGETGHVNLDTARFYLHWRQQQPRLPESTEKRPWVQIVPASFYRQFPQMGADGALIQSVAQRLGYPVERIETGSVSTVKQGARKVAEQLRKDAILVSLSKGGADALLALHQNPGQTRAWLQIGGLVRGTPLADAVLQAPWYQQALIKRYLRYHGGSWDLVHELKTRPAQAPHLPILNVLGCPCTFHLSGSTKRRHAFLKQPNDGTITLEDGYLGDNVVPIWGADHYFRVPGMARKLEHLLAWASNQ